MESLGPLDEPRGLFFLISHTKPGPNMASAVAMKVARRESREEKEVLISSRRFWGMLVGLLAWSDRRSASRVERDSAREARSVLCRRRRGGCYVPWRRG